MDKQKHSEMRASEVKRWLNCPPSIKMKRELKPSKYAKEGNRAHELALARVDFAEIELRASVNKAEVKEDDES